ncbi:MAG: SDR family oxidoreductase [Nitrospinaceae bacterium]|jgi:3-oxoacyl-[acyl-carrier protein] reductase|nr:SDR family oxidoreductase [Nitrospinaceae bacterium]MBT3435728.1 SDR family oxidoreductase [Nitrospinaceae bacterium]MBT4095281.1 SDR family oxidoreductase [Nitrospinaceae bacterium]MBT4429094.1 SDR family oxidoreductase [Nitrospinaceae bacterium]MBT5366915.1 SDR family oxidoreductase [Nitrospinaceae bacterium]
MRLEGKSVVVTGAAQGIGRAVVQAFANEGARVVVVDLNEEGGEETAKLVRDAGGEAVFHSADVSKVPDVEGMMDRCEAEFGPIDIMVNNAGIVRAAMLHKMAEEQFDQVIAVHLRGTWAGTQAAAKRMIPRKSGRIINVTSGAGLRGAIGQINYSSAKMGIVGVTKSASRELGRYGITVNAISPAAITPMTETIRTDERFTAKYLERISLGRWGTAEEMVGGFVFLASEEASYVTGIVLRIDGGMST